MSKDTIPQPKNIDQSYYYMNNNKPEYFINNNKNFNYNNNFYSQNKNYQNYNYMNENSPNNDLFRKVLFILFSLLIVFLIYDFISIYKDVKKDNNIERNRCIEEFKANKCDKIKINDGPIVNDFCTEKLKCIHEHTVYFHVVFIKYITSIISNSLRGNNLINISLFIITLLIIIRILY